MMRNQMLGVVFASLLFALGATTASATCMQTCSDTDAGDDPRFFGVTAVDSSCAAPGGPVSRTRADYYDSCGDGVHTEYFCRAPGVPGAGEIQSRQYRCHKCDPNRRGVCLRPGNAGQPANPPSPTQTCTTVTGGGPTDPPVCPPAPQCAPPPPGCVSQPVFDANGCIVGCGMGCTGPMGKSQN